MSRPLGTRNKDFEVKRHALLTKLTDFALNSDLRRPSLRQLAIAAEASEPTLRHYFQDRRGLVLAILAEIGRRGTDIWTIVAMPAIDVAAAMEEYFRISEVGMRHGGFVRAHAFGIIEGVADEEIGRAYLTHVLDPALRAIELKLEQTPGGPAAIDARKAAALAALAPMLVLSLHQDLLGGNTDNPIGFTPIANYLQTWLGTGLAADFGASS